MVGSYITTGNGDELAEGVDGSSSRMIGEEKPGCLGVGAMSHMLGNVSTSAGVGSTEPGVPRGGGLGVVSSFA